MRASEFITEGMFDRLFKPRLKFDFGEAGEELYCDVTLGDETVANFTFDRIGDDLEAQDMNVVAEYRGQGIAKRVYDMLKAKGFTIHRSVHQTDDGKRFWDKNRGVGSKVWEDRGQGAAGIILYAEDTGRYGLQQRSNTVNDPGLWAAWGGGREPGETLEQCARRELGEESGYWGPIEMRRLASNPRYVTYLGIIPEEFAPKPNEEWQDYCWVDAGDWPAPMHPGCAAALKNISVNENFADGKVKGKSRPGRVKRAGASCAGSVTSLRQKARQGGERGRMYHWCANMKSGKKNK